MTSRTIQNSGKKLSRTLQKTYQDSPKNLRISQNLLPENLPNLANPGRYSQFSTSSRVQYVNVIIYILFGFHILVSTLHEQNLNS